MGCSLDDFIAAGAGNDKLFGGDGDDELAGGEGNDTFFFRGGVGSDVVMDFAAGHDIVKVERGINGLEINAAADIANLAMNWAATCSSTSAMAIH